MNKKFKTFFPKIIAYAFYLFVFLLPWQTKLVLRSAPTNFTEISLYLTHILAVLILLAFFVYQWRQKSQNQKVSALWVSLLILETTVLISFFFASDQLLAFYYYVLFLIGIGLFYLLRFGLRSVAYEDGFLDRVKIIYSFLAAMFWQAILGIYQFLTQYAPANKYLGLAAHDPSQTGTAVIEIVSGRWLRAYGGLDHPNIFGGVLVIALILAAYLLAKQKVIRRNQEFVQSLFLFVFYFVALTALFFSFSRSAWLALVLGLIFMLIGFIKQKDHWVLGRFIALLLFSTALVLIIAQPYRGLINTRMEINTRLEQQSLDQRITYISQSENLINQHWLFGVGIGNYTLALQDFYHSDFSNVWSYQPVHDVFMLLWAEAGIGAFLSFLFFLFFLARDRRTILAAALLPALFIIMLFDHWLISLPFGILFLFLVAGLL